MISLLEMIEGQKGIVAEITGGHGLSQKLDNMGLHIGKEITKVNMQWRRGPVIVQLGNSQLAIGYGIAKKVMLKTNSYND